MVGLAATLLATACTDDKPYRDVRHNPVPLSSSWEVCVREDSGSPSSRTCEGNASIEHRAYETQDGQKGDYLLGFVEFDDQGWYHDIRQKDQFFATLNELDAKNRDKFIIVVYAHGWKHNAAADDSDVRDFQKLLERIDIMEAGRVADEAADPKTKRRKVVGLYLGWRGASVPIPWIEQLTFWTRKNAAQRVGGAGAKDLLPEIKNFKRLSNRDNSDDELGGPNETQLIITGHSFGGYLMFEALHSQILERATRLRGESEGAPYGTARSFGDFVLLVNPAFEGSIYEPLHRFATGRCYPPQQRPVMMIVTSESGWATGYAFPIGRWYTLTQSAPQDGQRETVQNTIGHLDRYRTHYLRIKRTEANQPVAEPKNLEPTRERKAESLADAALSGKRHQSSEALSKTAVPYGNSYLEPATKLSEQYPYFVVTAEKSVIRDHGDIFNENFIDFIAHFINGEIVNPKKADGTDGLNKYPACAQFIKPIAP
jgi:hypothetical protein